MFLIFLDPTVLKFLPGRPRLVLPPFLHNNCNYLYDDFCNLLPPTTWEKQQTVIFQNCCRPQGPAKRPDGGFKMFYRRRAQQKLKTVIFQNAARRAPQKGHTDRVTRWLFKKKKRRPQGPTKTANNDFVFFLLPARPYKTKLWLLNKTPFARPYEDFCNLFATCKALQQKQTCDCSTKKRPPQRPTKTTNSDFANLLPLLQKGRTVIQRKSAAGNALQKLQVLICPEMISLAWYHVFPQSRRADHERTKTL